MDALYSICGAKLSPSDLVQWLNVRLKVATSAFGCFGYVHICTVQVQSVQNVPTIME